jgi:hypothetical protein
LQHGRCANYALFINQINFVVPAALSKHQAVLLRRTTAP